ncbi:MAG: indole-3-glycerol-phosphate synthase [Candidatus Bathyarchaeia archaeon]|jgi:indole-3-glycerol phosphate synthase
MPSLLTKLIEDAERRVGTGYYDIRETVEHETVSLRQVLKSSHRNAIIAEIKPISPALGPLRPSMDPVDAAIKLAKGGAVALSVLTEPDNFGGKIETLRRIRRSVDLPLLMKDIIIHRSQIHAGKKSGADCILLIESVFSAHPTPSMQGLIHEAHQEQLEVVLEVHSEDELQKALESEADIIGVNNRNLATLETDINTTARLVGRINQRAGKAIISESGFENANDIRKLKTATVDGYLIGSSIMLSENLETKVREFVLA